MIQEFDFKGRFEELNAHIERYSEWFTASVANGLYASDALQPPDALLSWLEEVDFETINIDEQYVTKRDALIRQHEHVIAAANTFATAPDYKTFHDFSDSFKIFMADMHDLCQSVIMEQSGMDLLTGLKNNMLLESDFSIEAERKSREGSPFCIGIARIDDFKNLEPKLGKEKADACVKKVAEMLKRSLRSYDDAYRMTRHRFVLCLKQSDIVGGQKALKRFNDLLEEADEFKSGDIHLSVSCCVAEWQEGDVLEDLITHLRGDLDAQTRDQGTVLTHHELSPLERFVQKETEA